MADAGVTIEGLPPDPPRLNRWLARNRGYVAPRTATKERNLFVFSAMGPLGVKLVEYIDARSSLAPVAKVAEALTEADHFVAIHVDFSPGGSNQQHWVRAVASHTSDIQLMDPWIKGSSQEAYLMTRYALPSWDDPARAVFRIAIYQFVGESTALTAQSLNERAVVQEQLYTYQP